MTAPRLTLAGLTGDQSTIARLDQRVGLKVYPHNADPVISRKTSLRRLDWRSDTEGFVVAFQWSKRLGEYPGRWSAIIKLGRHASIDIMAGDILPGDWVDVVVLRNGLEFPLLRGRVQTVRQADRSERGATVRTITLTGSDHGELFKTIIAWNNIYVQTIRELGYGLFTFKIEGAPGGYPSDLFERIVQATFGAKPGATQSSWTLPPQLQDGDHAKTFLEQLDIRKGATRGLYYNESALWTNPGETLDQALQRWTNPLLNEVLVDLDPFEGPQMFAEIRERPFINTIDGYDSPWWSLPEWEVPNWLVDAGDLGRSDHERFTIYMVNADMQYFPSIEQTAMAPPLYSTAAIARHGIRPRLESTQFIASGADGRWVKERETWQRLLADWNAMNPYWLSGNKTCKILLPEVRIGDRFRIRAGTPDKDLVGYIEGIDMAYQWSASSTEGPNSRTTVHLTRGWEGDDQSLFKAVVDAAAAYTEVF